MNLTFEQLRQTNVCRCVKHFKHDLQEWTLAEWSNAVCGEAGEMANITKKIRGGQFTLDEKKEDLAKEIADVVIYCDLIAAAAGIDLGEAVINKFNEVSDRKGVDIKL